MRPQPSGEAVEFRTAQVQGKLNAKDCDDGVILAFRDVEYHEFVENLMQAVVSVTEVEISGIDAPHSNRPNKLWEAKADILPELVKFRFIHDFVVGASNGNTLSGKNLERRLANKARGGEIGWRKICGGNVEGTGLTSFYGRNPSRFVFAVRSAYT